MIKNAGGMVMEWSGGDIERAVMVSAGIIGSVMGTINFLPIYYSIKLWGIGNMMAHDVCTIIPC